MKRNFAIFGDFFALAILGVKGLMCYSIWPNLLDLLRTVGPNSEVFFSKVMTMGK